MKTCTKADVHNPSIVCNRPLPCIHHSAVIQCIPRSLKDTLEQLPAFNLKRMVQREGAWFIAPLIDIFLNWCDERGIQLQVDGEVIQGEMRHDLIADYSDFIKGKGKIL